ncbi:hypothetical protein BKA80DRAFT_17090 [Phyllosticta citrichinensis]
MAGNLGEFVILKPRRALRKSVRWVAVRSSIGSCRPEQTVGGQGKPEETRILLARFGRRQAVERLAVPRWFFPQQSWYFHPIHCSCCCLAGGVLVSCIRCSSCSNERFSTGGWFRCRCRSCCYDVVCCWSERKRQAVESSTGRCARVLAYPWCVSLWHAIFWLRIIGLAEYRQGLFPQLVALNTSTESGKKSI